MLASSVLSKLHLTTRIPVRPPNGLSLALSPSSSTFPRQAQPCAGAVHSPTVAKPLMTVPATPKLSPQHDNSPTCFSPTPTKASFVLTPTRATASSSSLLPESLKSPTLYKCLSEECENSVTEERETCRDCRNLIINIIKLNGPSSQRPGSLSVSHPMQGGSKETTSLASAPLPSSPIKSARKVPMPSEVEEEEEGPDALYFATGRRTKRANLSPYPASPRRRLRPLPLIVHETVERGRPGYSGRTRASQGQQQSTVEKTSMSLEDGVIIPIVHVRSTSDSCHYP